MSWLLRTAVCTLVTSLLGAKPAAAQDSSASDYEPDGSSGEAEQVVLTGPELAARTGYATPIGTLKRGERLREQVAGAIPFWLDVGYRFAPRWYVGAYGHYGLALRSATADKRCEDCQYTWVRYGAQVQYRAYVAGNQNLWVGLGFGQELLNVSIDEERRSASSTRGWELLNAQFGAEWEPTTGLGLGPYFSISIDSFSNRTTTCDRDSLCAAAERRVEETLEKGTTHGWVSFGLRVVALP